MNDDVLTMLADAQLALARVLWAPYCDRDRALQLAALAAKTHPDPEKRAAIATWLQMRAAPAIDDLAVAYLRRSLRENAARSS